MTSKQKDRAKRLNEQTQGVPIRLMERQFPGFVVLRLKRPIAFPPTLEELRNAIEWAQPLDERAIYRKLRSSLRNRLADALRKAKSGRSHGSLTKLSRDLIGCSILELRAHLEGQFQPGMTWENHGQWHVDHRKPCAAFDLSDKDQMRECFHHSNLQPLWARANMSKGAKIFR